MAAPAYQPPNEQTPPQAPPPAGVSMLTVATLAAILAATAAPTLATPQIADELKLRTPEERRILRTVLSQVEKVPIPRQQGIGVAQRFVSEMNQLRRAGFIPVSIQRMKRTIAHERAHGATPEQAAAEAANNEDRYWRQHVAAAQQRMLAANRIDGQRMQYGDMLGWHGYEDEKATPECMAAIGKNFSAVTPPEIGWPGIVHVGCRCFPGPPYPGGEMLP